MSLMMKKQTNIKDFQISNKKNKNKTNFKVKIKDRVLQEVSYQMKMLKKSKE